jgi:hypothetical protein
VQDRANFLAELYADLQAVERQSARRGLRSVVRLNGTSDLDWSHMRFRETGKNAFESFPNIQFYDYTKVFSRLLRPLPSNYYLIFSRSELNNLEAVRALRLGFNVAVVFQHVNLEETFLGHAMIDGDEHDLRFLDLKGPHGYIVALKAKGRARKDDSGFVLSQEVSSGRK